jgi:hypothetical protein
MAWEKRGNGLYYYRKRREGQRVISEYIGAGEFAQAIATLDALDRERRLLEWLEYQDKRTELETDRDFGREVDEVCVAIRTLTTAALLGAP